MYSSLTKIAFLAVFLFVSFLGYGQKKKKEKAPTESSVEAPVTTPAENMELQPKPATETAQSKSPAIVFAQNTYNFGKATQGEVVKYTFKFTNTGKSDLILSNVQASCGCTTPSWSRDPIKPGNSGEIQVAFNTAGKMGPQKKAVTITANTEPAVTMIYIEGEVTAQAVPNNN
ncbi:MAG: DUF1573 domain-containing protein [Bacteroidia bacterium]|nr:DUF1573 domain-containing protein [Bacteroidia bacterium]